MFPILSSKSDFKVARLKSYKVARLKSYDLWRNNGVFHKTSNALSVTYDRNLVRDTFVPRIGIARDLSFIYIYVRDNYVCRTSHQLCAVRHNCVCRTLRTSQLCVPYLTYLITLLVNCNTILQQRGRPGILHGFVLSLNEINLQQFISCPGTCRGQLGLLSFNFNYNCQIQLLCPLPRF